MKILSIYLGHNSTIAYLHDGVLKYVLHEEKFDNVKNSDNFPIKAMHYLAKKENLSDIDKIVVVGKWINRWMLRYIENYTKASKHKIINYLPTFYDRILYVLGKYTPWFMNWVNDSYIRWRQKKYSKKVYELINQWLWFDMPVEKIEFVSHHECHALSVVYFYGLHLSKEPVLVLTLDGAGDRHCATVSVWQDGKLERKAAVRYWYSIWDVWSKSFTGWMGMTPLEHEYKVMGLAAYSSPEYIKWTYDKLFKDTIKLDGMTWTSKIPGYKSHVYYHNKLWGERFDNIAGALQKYTEEIIIQWIKNCVEETGIKQVAFAWGVFMNVKLNQKIQEQTWLDKVYFMPSAWDDSTPIWWVLAGYMHMNGDLQKLPAVKSMYQGIRYTNEEVGEFLATKWDKYTIESFDTDDAIANKMVSLLEKFEIVAIFQWAWECWARSLCNRAILANASDLDSFHRVNDMIKMRDFWMPFAPTILEERAGKYLDKRDELKARTQDASYYMITAYGSTTLAQKHLKAALHQKDKTLRPQLVNATSNPLMYKILKAYEATTWMWWVMNTSLNIHWYPLVWTLEQALFTMDNSWLDHIMLNNYLVSKK